MEYQKFVPEGWENDLKSFSKSEVIEAAQKGQIIQGRVIKCDSNYNLYVDLGKEIKGIIPRDEIEAINIDETGFPRPNICTSKVNKIVQFKVKDVNDNDVAILSRKAVGKEALQWLRKELTEGTIVDRNSKKHKTLWRFY